MTVCLIVLGVCLTAAVAALAFTAATLARKCGELALRRPYFLVPQRPDGRIEMPLECPPAKDPPPASAGRPQMRVMDVPDLPHPDDDEPIVRRP